MRTRLLMWAIAGAIFLPLAILVTVYFARLPSNASVSQSGRHGSEPSPESFPVPDDAPGLSLQSAIAVSLPAASGDTAAAFTTPDGKSGWVRKISGEALPTPAFAQGRIFTGGGYHSRVFMAIDADSGKTAWTQETQDNGPTSPVVEDGVVAYNSESCHTEVRDIADGRLLWSEVTGGTLLTQPAITNNILVIPHPMVSRSSPAEEQHFKMLCVDLKTFKHIWDLDMTTDVFSAPVCTGERVYFTCNDGRLFAERIVGSVRSWDKNSYASSAPVALERYVAVTVESGGVVGIRRYAIDTGATIDETPLALTRVTAGSHPSWDYQGPKIAASPTHLFNTPGKTVNAVAIDDGKVAWRFELQADGLTNAADSLTPPALGKSRIYLGTGRGHFLALKKSDGALAFAYKLPFGLASQPILANGNAYLATTTGELVCLKLNSPDAADWHAWGGDARHNKIQ